MEASTVIDLKTLGEGGAPNLDGMTTAALYAFAAATRGMQPRKAARQLFPCSDRGAVTAVKALNGYAWNLITARACRLRGNIQTALMYEGICERIYQGLPAFARW